MPGNIKWLAPGFKAPTTRGEVRDFARFCKRQSVKSDNQFFRDVWYRLHEILDEFYENLPEEIPPDVKEERQEVRRKSSNYRYGGD